MNEEEKNTEKASRLNEAYRYLFANYNIKSQKQFAETIRVQRTALSAAFNGNPAYLTKNLFIKICAAFPVFNLDYFLTGRGNLTSAENKIDVTQISNSRNVTPESHLDISSVINTIIAAKDDAIESLKRELTTKDDLIQSLRDQLTAKDQLITEQKARLIEYRRIIDSRDSTLTNYPFPFGAAENAHKQNVSPKI